MLALVLCGLVQVPTEMSSRAGHLPPQARGAQDLPSSAWLDIMESIPVDSDRHVEPTGAASPIGAASRLRARSRLGTLKIEPALGC